MVGNLGRIAEAQVGGRDAARDGNYLYGAFGHDFGTSDGRRVMVVALTGRQWTALMEVTGTAEAFAEPRGRHRPRPLLRGRALRRARPDRGGPAAVVRGPLARRGPRGVRGHRRLVGPVPDVPPAGRARTRARREANPMFSTLEQPGIGSYLVPASPLDFSAAGRQPARPRAAARRAHRGDPRRRARARRGRDRPAVRLRDGRGRRGRRVTPFGVTSMTAPLRRVLVRRPATAGDWVGAGWRVPDAVALAAPARGVLRAAGASWARRSRSRPRSRARSTPSTCTTRC